MTQCVPSWPLDGSPSHLNLVLNSHSNNSSVTDAPEMDYEVAELTWENGQLVMHGLGPPRVPNKPLSTCSPTKYTWDIKPHAGGTLESIVNQATGIPNHQKSPVDGDGDRGDDFTRWFDNCLPDAQTSTTISTMAVDALVPTSSTNTPNSHQPMPPSIHVSGNTSRCVVSCSTRVASCSGDGEMARARMGSACEDIPKDFEITESFGNEEVKNLIRSTLYEGHNDTADQTVSQRDTVETGERDLGAERLTATSMGSPENTFKHCNSKTVYTVDDHDFISHGRAQREAGDDEHEDRDEKKGSKISSFSTKRSRAAATHNQSERKRRDRINQRMKTLQKLVPTSSKRTDKASMLDEVIEYLKQLQAQVKAMSRMIHVNMPSPMMLPNMALQQQQQLQMSMMGMPRPMDVNALNCPNITTMPSVLHATAPSNFNMPIVSPGASVVPDSLASFLPAAAQSQPMTIDAYGRMAALYQQYLQSNANLGFKN